MLYQLILLILLIILVDQSQCDASHSHYVSAPPIVKTIQSGEVVHGVVSCFEYVYYKIKGMLISYVINLFINSVGSMHEYEYLAWQ